MNKLVLFVFMVISMSLSSHAQPKDPTKDVPKGKGENNGQGNGKAAPIDGASVFLLTAGLLYGAHKVKRFPKFQSPGL